LGKRVGIGQYAFELLSQLEQITNNLKNLKFQIYLKELPIIDMPKERIGWKYIIVKPKKLWTQIGLPLYLYTHFPRPDVFFTPTHYAPRFSPVPTAVSVMDLSFLHFPDLFAKKDLYQLISWTKYSVKNAKKVFTISESSKNDILEKYQLGSEKVIVTYPGIRPKLNTNTMSKSQLKEKFGISENYILFVGTLQPRKNIVRLIEAFSILFKKLQIKDLELVVVGKKGWLYEDILDAPRKFDVEKEVKFLEFVQDEDLPTIYKNAICFVLPSLYEGFGLPVLEAMRNGCPVIASNVSSLPEAGGNAAIYVNPESTSDIAEKMEKVIKDKKLREGMIKKGSEQIKKFSWEKAAKKTLEVLEEVGGKP